MNIEKIFSTIGTFVFVGTASVVLGYILSRRSASAGKHIERSRRTVDDIQERNRAIEGQLDRAGQGIDRAKERIGQSLEIIERAKRK